MAVVILATDHFEAYNDTVGTSPVIRASRRWRSLRDQFRRPGHVVARYSGGEFVALARRVRRRRHGRDPRGVRTVQRMNIAHSAPAAGIITLSGGVAGAAPHHGLDPEARRRTVNCRAAAPPCRRLHRKGARFPAAPGPSPVELTRSDALLGPA
ncbi:MAG: GGDEF domain-containing protein [Actinobacteria bacterium]|nr:GGDEF domain-containing protein [Actinomycetota bacterium]